MPPQTPAIEASGLGKRFELRHERPASLVQQVMAIVRREPRSEPFWALRDVSFEVPRGRALGVIGRNGSGKSTLLKILAGTLRPTTGRLTVRGSVSTLLQIGGGFHPDFSGRNNAFVSAALLGIPSGQLRDQFDELVAFAELDRFIDVPTKYYSSGMLANGKITMGKRCFSSRYTCACTLPIALVTADVKNPQKSTPLKYSTGNAMPDVPTFMMVTKAKVITMVCTNGFTTDQYRPKND